MVAPLAKAGWLMGARGQRMVALGLALLLVIGGIAVLVRSIAGSAAGSAPTSAAAPTAVGCALVSTEPPGAVESGLAARPLCALPPEAATVARTIAAGGSFRYEQDGATFRNAEQLLPSKRQGYYREYTVPTPGSTDRGARRLIAGSGGEFYYTADHYESFVVVDVKATGNG